MNDLHDQVALQQLMGRYVDAANRRDGHAWSGTWAADGCWSLMGMEVEGREAILGLWEQVMAGFEFALLVPASHVIEISGDTAAGHWYLQEFTRDLQGQAMQAVSRYTDSYVRIEGAWFFQRRQYDFIYRGATPMDGDYTPLP